MAGTASETTLALLFRNYLLYAPVKDYIQYFCLRQADIHLMLVKRRRVRDGHITTVEFLAGARHAAVHVVLVGSRRLDLTAAAVMPGVNAWSGVRPGRRHDRVRACRVRDSSAHP